MGFKTGLAAVAAFAASLVGLAGMALAEQATPWQLGFQKAASPVMHAINSFHNLLLVIITTIVIFVTLLLLYVMVRFRESRNPTPSRTTHNTIVEVVWTVVPIMILVIIAIPSFRLLYVSDRTEAAGMTLKVTGQQFSWTYEYVDEDGLTFDSNLACQELPADGEDECAEAGKELWHTGGKPALRLLDVDNPVVVPVDTNIRVLVTADPDGVIHSWAMPAFGVKLDAVPGRINETWFRVDTAGAYYGQCSELCGTGHGYMPIKVIAMSKSDYANWLKRAREEFAGNGSGDAPARLAAAAR
jgi:cytochrome c oxidase subunit 2